LKLLEDIEKIVDGSNKKKCKNNSWIGCLPGKTKIKGNIIAPVIEEGEWEILSV
jgi:hypothetical protein